MIIDTPADLGGGQDDAATRRSHPGKSRTHFDKKTVRAAAEGRWSEIIAALGGISIDILDGGGHPCPQCGGTDRFNLNPDGSGRTHCRQCPHDAGDGFATIMWLTGDPFPQVLQQVAEYLGVPPDSGPLPKEEASSPPAPAASPASATPSATPDPADDAPDALPDDVADLRHAVYIYLAQYCGLSDDHREQLRKRGLTDAQIDIAGYWSVPRTGVSCIAGLYLSRDYDSQRIAECVPGVFPSGSHIRAHDCLMIPVCDADRRIIAIKKRLNKPMSDGCRYLWMSRTRQDPDDAPSSGSPCHVPVWDGDRSTIRITEGPLKANIATAISDVLTIGVGGATTWQSALPVLKQLRPRRVLISMDADAATNATVAGATVALWEHLAEQDSIEVAVETWPTTQGEDGSITPKGTDDALAAGVPITVLDGVAAEEHIAELRRVASGEDGDDGGPYFEIVTAAELDDGDYRLDYLVPGVVAAEQPLIIAGQFKTLKTSIAFDFSVALASGQPFLGHFGIPKKRRVLILTAESGLATVQDTCRRICRSHGIRLRDIDGLAVCDRVPMLENPSHVDELQKIIEAERFEVVVADPAYLMLDGDNAGNLFSMGSQLRTFAEMSLRAGATPILLHHAKKNNVNAIDYQPLELADLAWAGFAEFARQWLLLSRRERYAEGSGDHRLWMSVGGSAGHNGCWGVDIAEGSPDDPEGRRWEVSIDDAREARERAATEAEQRREAARQEQERKAMESNREKVLAAFRGVSPPRLTKKQIRDRASLNARSADIVVGYMIRIGELLDGVKATAGNGQKYDAFEIQWQKISE